MVSLLSVVALILAGLFFGSQFVPQKFCTGFDSKAYNLSMMLGIAVVTGIMLLLSFLIAIPGDVSVKEFSFSNIVLCIFAGVIWSAGNLFILAAVYKIGMSRTFPVVNLIIVVAFFAGIIFLSELQDVDFFLILLMALGIGSVLVGSVLTSRATSKEEKEVRDVRGGIIAAVISVIFFGFYNIPVLYSLRTETWSVYLAVFFLSLGAIIGGAVFGFVWLRKEMFVIWRKAKRKWHLLAISGGILWGAGQTSANLTMVEIGLSIGAPLIQGFVIVVGVVWGLVVFKEFADISPEHRRKAIVILSLGCCFAIMGSLVIGYVAGLLF
jgi:glucose uptake protein GlcU